ncbi:GNAT family N-acetyltransferase [Adonisia turfae]|uniref:N-acetyltransferase n=1 Tax=Adonisia turfae CCMR0081 TaxID=2292702 RepID=A0A6M0RSA3_9CYAN|nr:N-acetyltransferase [Adonisia turfae]NEZ58713.1 N-acetyltransferase [Adonisia turfae CCMR0081]
MIHTEYLVSHLVGKDATNLFLANKACLPYAQTLEAMTYLNEYLALMHGIKVSCPIMRSGIIQMLDNPSLGIYVLAWRASDLRLIGQIEVKEIFEAMYNSRYCYLDNFAVLPEFQKQGIGTALLKYVMHDLKPKNATKYFRLYLSSENCQLRNFYIDRGFSDIGQMLQH